MTRIYISARYTRKDEMNQKAMVLAGYGHQITSGWHSLSIKYPKGASAALLAADPDYCWGTHAQNDLGDLRSSNVIILFTSPEDHGTGGRHVEFGYALASGIPAIVIGPIENIFQILPTVKHYATWDDLCSDVDSLYAFGEVAR